MFSLLNVGGVDRCGHLLGLVITPRLSALWLRLRPGVQAARQPQECAL